MFAQKTSHRLAGIPDTAPRCETHGRVPPFARRRKELEDSRQYRVQRWFRGRESQRACPPHGSLPEPFHSRRELVSPLGCRRQARASALRRLLAVAVPFVTLQGGQ